MQTGFHGIRRKEQLAYRIRSVPTLLFSSTFFFSAKLLLLLCAGKLAREARLPSIQRSSLLVRVRMAVELTQEKEEGAQLAP